MDAETGVMIDAIAKKNVDELNRVRRTVAFHRLLLCMIERWKKGDKVIKHSPYNAVMFPEKVLAQNTNKHASHFALCRQRLKISLFVFIRYNCRMLKVVGGIIGIIFLLGGYFWWSTSDRSPQLVPAKTNPTESASPAISTKQQPPSVAPAPPVPTPPPTPPAILKKEFSSSPDEQSAVAAAAVRQFVYDLRTTLVHIGRAMAIAEGRYEVKEGEKIPTLLEEMKERAERYAALDTSMLDEAIQASVEELFRDTESLIQTFSDPPTQSELREADSKRQSIQKKADEILSSLSNI